MWVWYILQPIIIPHKFILNLRVYLPMYLVHFIRIILPLNKPNLYGKLPETLEIEIVLMKLVSIGVGVVMVI
jgi:hypothetical protein